MPSFDIAFARLGEFAPLWPADFGVIDVLAMDASVLRALISLVIGVVWVASAHACDPGSPPEPPPSPEAGENLDSFHARVEAYRAEHGARMERMRAEALSHHQCLWGESESVLLARIVRFRSGSDARARVLLDPTRPLKGPMWSRPFVLTTTWRTIRGEALTRPRLAPLGDTLVIFVRRGRPRQDSVIAFIEPEGILDQRVREALAQ